jgi:hypothetical protein
VASFLGPRLHIGLVDLHDVCPGGKEVTDLLVYRGRVIHRRLFFVRIVVVLRLLAHRERARHRHLDHLLRVHP